MRRDARGRRRRRVLAAARPRRQQIGESTGFAQAHARGDRVGQRDPAAARAGARARADAIVAAAFVIVLLTTRGRDDPFIPQQRQQHHGGEAEPEQMQSTQERDEKRLVSHGIQPSAARRAAQGLR
jgi:hypothetical protein